MYPVVETSANTSFLSIIKTNPRGEKPRKSGITEIRGPYYSVMGKRYLEDILDTMGSYVDSLKFAGGSFVLINPTALQEMIAIAHDHNVMVSTGGFIEYVLTQGKDAVKKYIQTCKNVGFDIIEISCGFITLPTDDLLRLIDIVHREGLKVKTEIGVQFGAGGSSQPAELKAEGLRDADYAIKQARRFINEGVYLVLLESEGLTENVDSWRTDIIAKFIDELGPEKLMFEAADPQVFEWYIKNYGYKVNLFVDHSQIVQLECLRSGIWGTKSTWGRIQGF